MSKQRSKKQFPWIPVISAVGVVVLIGTLVGLRFGAKYGPNAGEVLSFYQGLEGNLAAESTTNGNLVQIYTVGEVTPEQVQDLVDVAAFTANTFRHRPSINVEAVQLEFQQPSVQKIILVNLPERDLPVILRDRSEITLLGITETDYAIISFINISQYRVLRSADVYGAVVQAVCLGFTADDPNHDPECNFISLHAGMALAGVEPSVAEEFINGLDATQVCDQNDCTEVDYFWWAEIYNVFIRNNR